MIGIDDIPEAQVSSPALSTVRIDKRGIGERAAELLLDRLETPYREWRTILMPPQLIVRESCGGRAPLSQARTA